MVLTNFECKFAADITDENNSNSNCPAISVLSSNGYYGFCYVTKPTTIPATTTERATIEHNYCSKHNNNNDDDNDNNTIGNYEHGKKRRSNANYGVIAAKRYCYESNSSNNSNINSKMHSNTALNGTANLMDMDIDMPAVQPLLLVNSANTTQTNETSLNTGMHLSSNGATIEELSLTNCKQRAVMQSVTTATRTTGAAATTITSQLESVTSADLYASIHGGNLYQLKCDTEC